MSYKFIRFKKISSKEYGAIAAGDFANLNVGDSMNRTKRKTRMMELTLELLKLYSEHLKEELKERRKFEGAQVRTLAKVKRRRAFMPKRVRL